VTTDRRRGPRVPLSATFSESDPRTTTPVADLSRSGALVVGGPVHPIGSHIELCFVAFPEDPLPFVHTGRVVRHLQRTDAMGRPLAAMGVEFDAVPDDVAAQLDAILERAAEVDERRQRRSKRPRFISADVDLHELRTRILNE
jgi:hypothetical protein